jgi:DNA-binding transcriptional regulator of glucitol operon
MENKKAVNFIMVFIAIILGWTLFKQFDFESLKFKNTGLAIVYMITFSFSIYCLIKDYKNKPKQ